MTAGWQGTSWHPNPDEPSAAPAVAAEDADETLCSACFPAAGSLAELVTAARAGHYAVPYVGDGSPDTELACPHGAWRLGDLLADPEEGQADGEDQVRQCADPACDKDAAKNRRWCGTHASPANRTAS